jgi:hypothetical protein
MAAEPSQTSSYNVISQEVRVIYEDHLRFPIVITAEQWHPVWKSELSPEDIDEQFISELNRDAVPLKALRMSRGRLDPADVLDEILVTALTGEPDTDIHYFARPDQLPTKVERRLRLKFDFPALRLLRSDLLHYEIAIGQSPNLQAVSLKELLATATVVVKRFRNPEEFVIASAAATAGKDLFMHQYEAAFLVSLSGVGVALIFSFSPVIRRLLSRGRTRE